MTAHHDDDQLVSASYIAAAFGVDIKAPARWSRRGLLPEALRTPGGHRRWRKADVDALARRLRAEAAGAPL